jgi:hypothetical protein
VETFAERRWRGVEGVGRIVGGRTGRPTVVTTRTYQPNETGPPVDGRPEPLTSQKGSSFDREMTSLDRYFPRVIEVVESKP